MDMHKDINACIVELSIGCWTARKLDKQTSKEVMASKDAVSSEAARVNKNLFAGMDNLKQITDFVASVRNDFYNMTLPWSDTGQRLVPMTQYYTLVSWLGDKEREFNTLVDNFVLEYPNLISAQAFQLGKLFNRAEYPPVDDIRSKFRFSVAYLPVPSVGDFRVQMVDDAKASLQEQFERTLTQRLEAVQTDLWQRLHDALKHMSERLGYDETGKKRVFRDTLVSNAVELCDLLKRLNVTGDPKLEQARQGLESALLGVDADELRSRAGAREEVKAKVDAVLSSWL